MYVLTLDELLNTLSEKYITQIQNIFNDVPETEKLKYIINMI